MRPLTLAAAVLLAALAGCYNADESAPRRSQRAPASARIDVGQKAPEIDGADLDGKHFKLSDNLGKVVLLDFWATT